MPRPAVRTDRTDCPRCRARVILARGVPPLDWAPGRYGTIAAAHQASGAWTARRLGFGERPVAPEHRHAIHRCEEHPP